MSKHFQMCKDEFREKLENFDLKAEAPFLFWAIAKNRYTWSRFTQKQVRPTYNQVKTHFPGHKRDTKATNIFALCIAILLLGLFHLLDDHFYITRNPKQL